MISQIDIYSKLFVKPYAQCCHVRSLLWRPWKARKCWIQVEMSLFLESDSVLIFDLEPVAMPRFGVSLRCKSQLR